MVRRNVEIAVAVLVLSTALRAVALVDRLRGAA
jgi:hypothetical protein